MTRDVVILEALTEPRSTVPAARPRTSASCRGSTGSMCRPASASRPTRSGGSWPRRRRSTVALDRLSRLGPGRPGGHRRAQRRGPPDHRGDRHPRRPAGGDHARARRRLGEHAAYAVRSSATAEDLPTASFAGQQDTYLNVVGAAAILEHVRPLLGVAVHRAGGHLPPAQRLRPPHGPHGRGRAADGVAQAAGILFTADPVTSNRKVASIEASFGLGEALVSGLVNADVYQVRDGEVVAKSIGAKQLAIHALRRRDRAAGHRAGAQEQPVLTDAQVLRLAQLGRRIEAHFGRPQDIEWCLADDELPDRPEPADHHAVPDPRSRRRRQPRLRLRRPPADDDRRHEAARAVAVGS